MNKLRRILEDRKARKAAMKNKTFLVENDKGEEIGFTKIDKESGDITEEVIDTENNEEVVVKETVKYKKKNKTKKK